MTHTGIKKSTDDEIIEYFMKYPASSMKEARRRFNCRHTRATELRKIALRRVEAGSGIRDKKVGKVDWREYVMHAEKSQELRHKRSWSQDHAIINMQEKFNFPKDKPVVIQGLGDLHIGSMASNYSMLKEITDGIINTPNLFVFLTGDLLETTAVFKNALAVHSQVMDIETQHDVLESWLDTIGSKVIAAGWCNHGVEREEKYGAYSHIKAVLNRRFVYHNGMGRIDIEHGDAVYKLVLSHKISGCSIFNRLHGAKRLLRLEFPDVDICMTADKHTPDIETYYEGQFKRLVMMNGTLKTDDGYSKRYFSLYTHMDMPCLVLYPDKKWFAGYMTAAEALAVANGLTDVPTW